MDEVTPLRVVLADDHAVLRAGLRSELGDGFHVVGEADDAEGAIDVINGRRPDLVVCDLHMPRGGGLAVVRACATIAPIVILTVSEAERDLLDAVAAGAAGYLLKTTPTDELRREFMRAARGEPVFSPSLAALVLGEFRRLAKTAGANPLSDREREVLQLVARGHPYAVYRNRPWHLGQDRGKPRAQHSRQAAPQPPGRPGALRRRARHRLGPRSASTRCRFTTSPTAKHRERLSSRCSGRRGSGGTV